MGEPETPANEEGQHTSGSRLNAEKTTIFPNLIYRLNAIPVKTSASSLQNLTKMVLKLYRKINGHNSQDADDRQQTTGSRRHPPQILKQCERWWLRLLALTARGEDGTVGKWGGINQLPIKPAGLRCASSLGTDVFKTLISTVDRKCGFLFFFLMN